MDVIRNCDVEGVVYAVPKGHKHYRLVVILRDGRILVFSEAFVANIVRAYVTVHTHPVKRAIELKRFVLTEGEKKDGYAKCQLLEIEKEKKEEEIREKVRSILDSASN